MKPNAPTEMGGPASRPTLPQAPPEAQARGLERFGKFVRVAKLGAGGMPSTPGGSAPRPATAQVDA